MRTPISRRLAIAAMQASVILSSGPLLTPERHEAVKRECAADLERIEKARLKRERKAAKRAMNATT